MNDSENIFFNNKIFQFASGLVFLLSIFILANPDFNIKLDNLYFASQIFGGVLAPLFSMLTIMYLIQQYSEEKKSKAIELILRTYEKRSEILRNELGKFNETSNELGFRSEDIPLVFGSEAIRVKFKIMGKLIFTNENFIKTTLQLDLLLNITKNLDNESKLFQRKLLIADFKDLLVILEEIYKKHDANSELYKSIIELNLGRF